MFKTFLMINEFFYEKVFFELCNLFKVYNKIYKSNKLSEFTRLGHRLPGVLISDECQNELHNFPKKV